jgi:hypothetical protein
MNAFYGIRRGVEMTASRAISFAHDDSKFRLSDFMMRSEKRSSEWLHNSKHHMLQQKGRGVSVFLLVNLSRTNFFSYGEELKFWFKVSNKKERLLDLPLYV